MFGHPLASLVQSLRAINDGSLCIGAIVELFLEFGEVFTGDYLIVKGNWILIGTVSTDSLVKTIAFVVVVIIAIVVVLL